jgi:hypothetical protein
MRASQKHFAIEELTAMLQDQRTMIIALVDSSTLNRSTR